MLALFTIGLVSPALAHSYLTQPRGRRNKDTCTGIAPSFHYQTGLNCKGISGLPGPCEYTKGSPSPRITVQRGQELDIRWTRNNHNGGFVRFAWSKWEDSDLYSSFDNGIQKYACAENGPGHNGAQCKGDAANGLGNDSQGEDGLSCGTTLHVPLYLTDGNWVLQWAYYGVFSDYWSCVDYTVSGGPTGPRAPVFFQGGDFLNPGKNVCEFCHTDRLYQVLYEPPRDPMNNPFWTLKSQMSCDLNPEDFRSAPHHPVNWGGAMVTVQARSFQGASVASIPPTTNAVAPTIVAIQPTKQPTVGAGGIYATCTKYSTTGWHDGNVFTKFLPVNGVPLTWQECAAKCAANTRCEWWILQEKTTSARECQLAENQGVYHDDGGHSEGDRVEDCGVANFVPTTPPPTPPTTNIRPTVAPPTSANINFAVTYTLTITVDRPPGQLEGSALNTWLLAVADMLGIPPASVSRVNVAVDSANPNQAKVSFDTGPTNFVPALTRAFEVDAARISALNIVADVGRDVSTTLTSSASAFAGWAILFAPVMLFL